ncbi:MAG: deoxyribodipyrimidine photo-lyase, partial [Thermoleophilia bacterium]|nr:deoxyribodipyrimidine photo-lyase [Thermoleophilia bacterium]
MGDDPRPTIVWLRRDLRLADNPALVEASRRGLPVVPVALWPRQDGSAPPVPGGFDAARTGTAGAASRWWLARSLAALGEDLRRRGSGLVVRATDGDADGAAASLTELAAATKARRVVWARGVDPAQRAEDTAVHRALTGIAVAATVVPSAALLADPETVRTSQGEPYRVFTPFWRAVGAEYRPPGTLPAPPLTSVPATVPAGLSVADLESDAVRPWSAGFEDEWEPGEAGAHARLARLLDDVLAGYADDRDRPDLEGSSRLSPHLHWGELTARHVWQAVAGRLAESGSEAEAAIGPPSWKEGAAAPAGGLARGAAAFLRQLGWRDFAHHLLWHFPDTVTEPLRDQFAAFPWRDDPDGLVAWQGGATGYPFVDAAMRSLWTTGWMHNRARLVAGSFLVKDLLLPW